MKLGKSILVSFIPLLLALCCPMQVLAQEHAAAPIKEFIANDGE